MIYVSFPRRNPRVADTITVLRNGRLIRTSARPTNPRDAGRRRHRAGLSIAISAAAGGAADRPPVLKVSGLTARGCSRDVSLDVRPGEIVGFAGLVGAGRSELAHAIYGTITRPMPEPSSSTATGSTRRARAGASMPAWLSFPGIAARPGADPRATDRQNTSLCPISSASALAAARQGQGTAVGDESFTETAVKYSSLYARVDTLSGGNQLRSLFRARRDRQAAPVDCRRADARCRRRRQTASTK